jgi:hypothetical protein
VDPARQPLYFAGGNRYAPDLIPHPSLFQTCPLPLLLAALPVGEIPATPRAKVLRPSHYELPVASLHLPPRLWTAGKPHYRRGLTSSCCAGQSLSSLLDRRNASARNPATTPRAAPLLPPPLLAPHAAPSSLQLRRHRALACPCTPRGHHQHTPYPAHPLTTSVRTKMHSASPPHQLLPIAASLCSTPTSGRSHYPSMVMCCMPCLSCPIPLTPCARL